MYVIGSAFFSSEGVVGLHVFGWVFRRDSGRILSMRVVGCFLEDGFVLAFSVLVLWF